ncbi:hypothetical protein WICPIJ_000243 [Wickerhamomyces pijperi]|uniref:Uncharacterized protein n=1 Tax=Wickerhamomyces pijperi TaxID=599730 RepID=A0A9P8TSA2_WICPI|nr:hypothetical protein WICPIJ_000243 [Wickerhamomyces pijperi]
MDSLYGITVLCFGDSAKRVRIRPKVTSDLLILLPSCCLIFSRPSLATNFSDPAKSTSFKFDLSLTNEFVSGSNCSCTTVTVRMECDLDDCLFRCVSAVVLLSNPLASNSIISCELPTVYSLKFSTNGTLLLFSLTRNFSPVPSRSTTFA